ncbi:MAG: DUF5947 family protein [Solirubrobacteraceae bacterium]
MSADPQGRRLLADAVASRRRAQMVSGLRGLAKPRNGTPAADPALGTEHCDLCGITIADDHRHLLALVERRIVCSCEACWAMRSGEGDYRPVGNRTLWLPDLDVPDDLWASFQIPIGLAFFMQSTVTACVVAMYPSPAGATESELHFETWQRIVQLNPALDDLEPDIEGLIVNRLTEPAVYAIAPIDACYALTGAIKLTWEGISGGAGVGEAVTRFFDELRDRAVAA